MSKELTTNNEDERRISPSGESGSGTRRLQDEINTLTKRNGGMNMLRFILFVWIVSLGFKAPTNCDLKFYCTGLWNVKYGRIRVG